MLYRTKKPDSLVIVVICVCFTVATFPGQLLAATAIEQWVARYDGPGNSTDCPVAMAVDASGNVYVTGTSDGSGTYGDYATVKYDSSGTALWVARYNGPENGEDNARAVTVDASGNVYVTGASGGDLPPFYVPPAMYGLAILRRCAERKLQRFP